MSNHLRYEKQNGGHDILKTIQLINLFLRLRTVNMCPLLGGPLRTNKIFLLFCLNKKERILGLKMTFSAFCLRFLKMSIFSLFGSSLNNY